MAAYQYLTSQATVLIADQHSFSAAYLRHALAAFGCRVIGPFDSHDALDALELTGDNRPSAAILALDWLDGADGPLIARLAALNVPYLLVDNAPWRHLKAIPVSFAWPYAAFQVVEALQHAMLGSPTSAERPHA